MLHRVAAAVEQRGMRSFHRLLTDRLYGDAVAKNPAARVKHYLLADFGCPAAAQLHRYFLTGVSGKTGRGFDNLVYSDHNGAVRHRNVFHGGGPELHDG